VEKAIQLLENEIETNKQMDLVNSSKAYAILYHLVAIKIDISRRNNEDTIVLEGKLDNYAAKCQEKNTSRDIEYSELYVSQLIQGGGRTAAADLNSFLRKSKLNIYDFTYTVPDLIPKL
jgi:hypothetical protein